MSGGYIKNLVSIWKMIGCGERSQASLISPVKTIEGGALSEFQKRKIESIVGRECVRSDRLEKNTDAEDGRDDVNKGGEEFSIGNVDVDVCKSRESVGNHVYLDHDDECVDFDVHESFQSGKSKVIPDKPDPRVKVEIGLCY